jgi:thiamine monophosphate kinase
LGDGEDFELLLAVDSNRLGELPREVAGIPLTQIGTFVSRTGLWARNKRGLVQLPARGYVHS